MLPKPQQAPYSSSVPGEWVTVLPSWWKIVSPSPHQPSEPGVDLEDIAQIVAAAVDVEDGVQAVLHRVAPPPCTMEPALLAGVRLARLVVDAVSHALRVVAVAVVGQHEPGPPGEGHRQVTHVAEMVDLQGRRLVVDGVAAHGPEEVGQRHVDARAGSSSQNTFSTSPG